MYDDLIVAAKNLGAIEERQRIVNILREAGHPESLIELIKGETD
jgi:hypothetical protein